MAVLLDLPNELLARILSLVPGRDAHRALRGPLLANRRLNVVARELAYRSVVLSPPDHPDPSDDATPHVALAEHVSLLHIQPDIGECIRHLTYLGLTTDAAPSPARCSIATERAVVEFCERTPGLKTIELARCFFEAGDADIEPAGITGVEHIFLRHATPLDDYPFPTAFARHFPDARKLTLSTAVCIEPDPRIADTIGADYLDITDFTLEPSYPIPTAIVEGIVRAAGETLRKLILYLPLIATPPDFAVPDELFIHDAAELETLIVVYPLFMFPYLLQVRDTWHFSATLILSASPALAELTLAFDAGARLTDHVLGRLASLPIELVEALLDQLPATLKVNFELRVGARAPLPDWTSVLQVHPDWMDIAQRPNVNLTVARMPTEASPFRLAGDLPHHPGLSTNAFIAWYRGEFVHA